MNARDHALGLLAAIKQNDVPTFERLLKELEESCRSIAANRDHKDGNRLRTAFEKWKATYLALRQRNNDLPPPEPFFYSGPYLTLLRTVISKRELLGETAFRYLAADIVQKARHARAHRCVMFHTLYQENVGHTTDEAVFYLQERFRDVFDNPRFAAMKARPCDLYDDYLYARGFGIDIVES
jgi:hypothetical protein